MRRRQNALRCLLFAALAASCSGCLGKLAMVGLDKDGKPTQAFVDDDGYVQRAAEAMLQVEDSVAEAMSGDPAHNARWSLRTIVLGFGLNAEAGFGPFKIGLKPRLRSVLAKDANAPIP